MPLLPVIAVLLIPLAGCGAVPHDVVRPATVPRLVRAVIVPNPTGHPDSFYEPNPIRVRLGGTVLWTNKDTDPHDVTSVHGLFDSGPIAAGASYVWRALHLGTYHYFCTLHPEMHGVIIVQR